MIKNFDLLVDIIINRFMEMHDVFVGTDLDYIYIYVKNDHICNIYFYNDRIVVYSIHGDMFNFYYDSFVDVDEFIGFTFCKLFYIQNRLFI